MESLSARLLEGGASYDSPLAIEVELEPAESASDLIAFLPQLVALVSTMCRSVGLVQALAGDKLLKYLLVGAFVDVSSKRCLSLGGCSAC